jgi:hypothetical protein
MQKILIICGKKQAGKSTVASYIQGSIYKNLGTISDFKVEDGKLTTYSNHPDHPIKIAYLNSVCRQFGFADVPKKMLVDIMGLRPEQVYGTNLEKDTLTNYRWQDMPGLSETQYKGRTGFMTGRDILQYVLTEVFRKMNDRIWVDAGYAKLEKSQTKFGIFNDGRHPAEIETGKAKGAKIIRLTRNPCRGDTHDSEVALDPDRYDWSNFDAVIRNDSLTELETFERAKPYLREWGWLETSSQECDVL